MTSKPKLECEECGYPAEYHHTPPSPMKRCDLDFRCFPKDEWGEVREKIRVRALEADNHDLKILVETKNAEIERLRKVLKNIASTYDGDACPECFSIEKAVEALIWLRDGGVYGECLRQRSHRIRGLVCCGGFVAASLGGDEMAMTREVLAKWKGER